MSERRIHIVVSGHRPERLGKVYDPQDQEPAVRVIMEELASYLEAGAADLWCGMAEGFDMMCATAALKLRQTGQDIRLRPIIPWPGFDEGFKNPRARSHYALALKRVEECGLEPAYTAPIKPVLEDGKPNGPAINKVLFRRNMQLADQLGEPGDVFLVAWNGDEHERSGTLNTIKYARRERRWEPVNIYRYVLEALAAAPKKKPGAM